MIETKFFYVGVDSDMVRSGAFMAPVLFHDSGFIEQHGEGWVPVDHAYIQKPGGEIVISIMANRELTIGDAPDFLPRR